MRKSGKFFYYPKTFVLVLSNVSGVFPLSLLFQSNLSRWEVVELLYVTSQKVTSDQKNFHQLSCLWIFLYHVSRHLYLHASVQLTADNWKTEIMGIRHEKIKFSSAIRILGLRKFPHKCGSFSFNIKKFEWYKFYHL